MPKNEHTKAKFKRQIRNYAHLIKGLQAISTVVLPLVVAIAVNLWTSAQDPSNRQFWGYCLALLGIVQFVSALLLLAAEKPAMELWADYDDMEEGLNNLKGKLEAKDQWLDRLNVALSGAIWALGAVNLLREESVSDEKEICERILQPFVWQRDTLFDYCEREAYWNFAVYKVDSAQTPRKLHELWRSCDDRIKQTNRTWDIGEGHVGRCFQRNELLISYEPPGDTGELVRQQLRPSNHREEDDLYYRSFLTIPISVCDKRWGVFVATSSIKNQFSVEEHQQIAQLIGMLLAQGLYSTTRGGRNGRNSPARGNRPGR